MITFLIAAISQPIVPLAVLLSVTACEFARFGYDIILRPYQPQCGNENLGCGQRYIHHNRKQEHTPKRAIG